jgi:hypothetical protein
MTLNARAIVILLPDILDDRKMHGLIIIAHSHCPITADEWILSFS